MKNSKSPKKSRLKINQDSFQSIVFLTRDIIILAFYFPFYSFKFADEKEKMILFNFLLKIKKVKQKNPPQNENIFPQNKHLFLLNTLLAEA